ncbi:MAG: hypothetical protein ACHQ9S_06745 [Candidatus Binatia bacterium]
MLTTAAAAATLVAATVVIALFWWISPLSSEQPQTAAAPGRPTAKTQSAGESAWKPSVAGAPVPAIHPMPHGAVSAPPVPAAPAPRGGPSRRRAPDAAKNRGIAQGLSDLAQDPEAMQQLDITGDSRQ